VDRRHQFPITKATRRPDAGPALSWMWLVSDEIRLMSPRATACTRCSNNRRSDIAQHHRPREVNALPSLGVRRRTRRVAVEASHRNVVNASRGEGDCQMVDSRRGRKFRLCAQFRMAFSAQRRPAAAPRMATQHSTVKRLLETGTAKQQQAALRSTRSLRAEKRSWNVSCHRMLRAVRLATSGLWDVAQ